MEVLQRKVKISSEFQQEELHSKCMKIKQYALE